jgi:hypothetical protein
MASTTNYGWSTPDDTSLVKDGASAIRTLGSSIDSTLKTQVDNTVASSIQKSLLTTTGDVIYASAASTPARLGIGTSGQILSVNGSGLPAWTTPAGGGGMTSIATGTLSGTSVTISSIPQTYNSLILNISAPRSTASSSALFVRVNNDATADQEQVWMESGTTTIGANTGRTGYGANAINVTSTATQAWAQYEFPNYAFSNVGKPAYVISTDDSAAGSRLGTSIRNTLVDPITSLVITTSSALTFTSGTYTLWGIK